MSETKTKGIRRFYKTADFEPLGDGYTVTLDGRPVRTPMRAPLSVPSPVLAEAIAAEWAAQQETVDPHTMPLTRLANTAIDRVGPLRKEVAAELVGYAQTDLLCYHEDEKDDLAQRQELMWRPVLDWAAEHLEAPFKVTKGILPVGQPSETIKAVAQALDTYDDLQLTAVQSIASACGSVVLALAVAEGRIDAETAFAASQLDETYQNEQWGQDAEDMKRRKALRTEIEAGVHFLALLAP